MNTKLFSIHLLKPVLSSDLEHLNALIRGEIINIKYQTQSSKMIFIVFEATDEDYTFLKLRYENLIPR